MSRLILAAATMLAATSVAGAALASSENCTSRPRAEWMSIEKVKAQAKAAGYDVVRTKIEGSCYELYARKNGRRHELLMHPVSGKLLGTERH